MSTANPAIFGAHDLQKDLEALGVRPGDGVFVHSALSKIGYVTAGPRGLIEALIAAVGTDGLIGMPGFSTDAYDPVELMALTVDPAQHTAIRSQVTGYDPARSSARQNGSVVEAFRCWPEVVRSAHPTSSVLLLGPDAPSLATHHDSTGWATGPDTPWGRLRKRPNMKILLIGVGWDRCSALHAAESAASHRRTKRRCFKTGPAGSPWVEAPDVADDLGTLFPLVGEAFEATGSVPTGRIGMAESRLCGYDPLVGFSSEWIGSRNAADGLPSA